MRRAWLAALALLAAGCSTQAAPADPQPGATRAWRPLADATLERTEVAAARVGRFVYVVGGFARDGGATTAAVERYDLAGDRWDRVADLPVGVNHAAAVSHRGSLYVLGGYRAASGLEAETDALYRYDPGRDRWRKLPSMPTPRGALAAGVVGGRLYAVGGAGGGRALDTVEVFDLARRTWRRGPRLTLAREHLAATVASGRLYVLAGRAAGRGNFSRAEVLTGGRFKRIADVRKARGGIAAAPVGRDVVLLGGEEAAGTIAEVERYDASARRWRRLPDLRTPRHGLGAVSRGGRVFALAGGDRPGLFFTRALEYLDVSRR